MVTRLLSALGDSACCTNLKATPSTVHLIARPVRALQRPDRAVYPCRCRTATLEELQVAAEKYVWSGNDEFDVLDDRRDAPPLPLAPLKSPKRVVLVRHGQSTWNAEGRVQGCCNLSVLTDKGKSQAHTTKDLVRAFSR